jgi:cellulose synthase (UDP-forming)
MNRSQRVQYGALSVLFLAAILWFAYNWFSRENLPSNYSSRPILIDVLLFGALSLVLLHPVMMLVLGWVVAGFVKANDSITPPMTMTTPLRVAMITTYVGSSEPLSILAATLKSMRNAEDLDGWSHDVWVLDERTNHEHNSAVERLCRSLGVRYFSRKGIEKYHMVGSKFTPKSKGGNHNAWYDAHGFEEYDIVAQFDTDFVVRRDVLKKILPFFSNPKLGWVGTPQIYTNTDHFIARGAAEQTYGFYSAFMRGLNGMKATLLIGANHTIRVSALRDIGGYDPHLTEDLATGMALHARGWESRYVPLALAHGEGPTTWNAYFKQQFRWAKGCLDLLLTSSIPRVKTMPKRQAFFYLWLQLFYLNGLFFGVALTLMMLKFCFGWESTVLNFGTFLVSYLPVLAMMELTMLWAQKLNIRPEKEHGLYLRARVLMLAVMPVYLWAFISAVRDRGQHTEFEVTVKGGMTAKVTITPGRKKVDVFSPHVYILAICITGFAIGLVLGHLDAVNVLWALFVISTFLILVLRPEWFELKNEFIIQSRRFVKTVKRENRVLVSHQKRLRNIVKRELRTIRSSRPADLVTFTSPEGDRASLIVLEQALDAVVLKKGTIIS